MAFNQWWTFTEGLVETDRDEPGVYELGNSNETIIYIGSSKEIRRRLKEHRAEPDSTCIKTNTATYRIEYTSNYKKREQELYDEFVRANGKAPQCNDARPSGTY